MQQSELPEGWASTKFEDIVQNYDGKRIPLKSDDRKKRQGEYSYYGASGVIDYIDDYIFDGEYLLISEDGANLVARNTPIAFIAKGQFWVNNHAHIVKTKGNIPLEYLSYFFNSLNLLPFITGSAQPKLTQSNLNNIEISLPPLPEQYRIVIAIEALFARLDATNERLDRVPGIIKRFRQAVLAAACDGRLTEDCREENPDIESVSLTINKLQSTGRDTKNRANYKVKKMDESNLSDLPRKWEWHSIIEVSNRVTVGHVGPMKDEYVEDGIPFLRSQNVRENRYDPSGLKFISPDFHKKIKKSLLEPNDLVVVRSGNVGVSCVIPDHLKEANCSDLVVVKQPFGFVSKYGSYYLNSIAKSTIDLNKVGIALSHFNTQSVANLPIPLPPLPEQQEIVRRVDALFAFADSIEAKVAVAREKTERLRQSILAKAFSGELVPTEAELARQEGREYESAEVLLERIKAEGKSGKK